MEYKRKRLIRAALQKTESKRKQTVRQAESTAATEQQTPEEYAQTVVSEKAIHTAENLQSKALDTGHRTNQLPSVPNFAGKAPACANHTRRPAR